MSRTLSYLRADLCRAESQGARTLDVNALDLAEVLALAEKALAYDLANKATTHAGWVNPHALSDLLSGRINGISLRRRRSDAHNTQVFFTGNLREQREVTPPIQPRETTKNE